MSKICAFLLFTLRLHSRYAQGERGLIRVRTDSVHESSTLYLYYPGTPSLSNYNIPLTLSAWMFLERGLVFAPEAVWHWEALLAPRLGLDNHN